MKRFLAFLLATMMLLFVMAGCKGTMMENETKPESSQSEGNEKNGTKKEESQANSFFGDITKEDRQETVTGQGDDVTNKIIVGDGLYRVHFTHDGSSNFIVHDFLENGDEVYLVNAIGAYDGYVLLSKETNHMFEIVADGNWSYTIERITQTKETEFSGSGDFVSGVFDVTEGPWEFRHDGESNFIVHLIDENGEHFIVNTIGKYDGKKVVSPSESGKGVFIITADGNWSMAPVK